ncbi:MAG TPA: fused MFS/spermidine synthase [Acidimicrobiia bacterium]|nr:fused MFS/spermidine synthase [Acidimicrobiia bacterium]
MPALVAAALVFICSGCVLVLEILAGRLLAPYVGISLETYTAIIGTVLAGIAAGSWLGGKVADRVDPRRLIGPTVALGGLLALFTVPVVRALGADASGGGGRITTIWLTVAGFFLPAFVLSAVHPMVVKLQLRNLERTGGVVGRLSGISTAGALVGTFLTGYLLVAEWPTRTVLYVVGGVLIALGVGITIWLSRRQSAVVIGIVVLAAAGVTIAAKSSEPCDVESAYYCIHVEHDLVNPSGRTLWLDDLRHSYVDLDDPSDLAFEYVRSFADVVAARFPDHPALDALHIGGGGFTMPRYLRAEYPGSQSTVLEIDPAVLAIGRDELGLRTGPDLRVKIGDARIGIRDRPDDSADLVVSDAFGSLSVPWHLTTTEFVGEVHRVLRDDGVYVLNIIDYRPLRFVRSELRTLQEHFGHVALIAPRYVLDTEFGGNSVLVAANSPVDEAALRKLVHANGSQLVTGDALERFIGDAPVITDDFAPIDQWLAQDKQ